MIYNKGLSLKQIRVEKNMSCEDVANLLGISRQRYSEIEKDPYKVKISTLDKVLQIYGYDLSLFFKEKYGNTPCEEE